MLKTFTVKERLSKLILAGVLGVSMCLPAGMAFAADNQPSTGEQTGTGKTTMKMIVKKSGSMSGADEDVWTGNPDENHDGLGDNIAFTVPSTINYVVSADGALTGPSNLYIKNESEFPIHVSDIYAWNSDGFSLVEDVTKSSDLNAFDFQIGPEGNLVNGAMWHEDFDNTAWNMGATDGGIVADDSYHEGWVEMCKHLLNLSAERGSGEPVSLDSSSIEDISKQFDGDGTIYIRADASEPWVALESMIAVAENQGNFTDVNGRTLSITVLKDPETGNPYIEGGMFGMKLDYPETLPLQTSGHVANVTKDISQLTEFGTIRWFMEAGIAK